MSVIGASFVLQYVSVINKWSWRWQCVDCCSCSGFVAEMQQKQRATVVEDLETGAHTQTHTHTANWNLEMKHILLIPTRCRLGELVSPLICNKDTNFPDRASQREWQLWAIQQHMRSILNSACAVRTVLLPYFFWHFSDSSTVWTSDRPSLFFFFISCVFRNL